MNMSLGHTGKPQSNIGAFTERDPDALNRFMNDPTEKENNLREGSIQSSLSDWLEANILPSPDQNNFVDNLSSGFLNSPNNSKIRNDVGNANVVKQQIQQVAATTVLSQTSSSVSSQGTQHLQYVLQQPFPYQQMSHFTQLPSGSQTQPLLINNTLMQGRPQLGGGTVSSVITPGIPAGRPVILAGQPAVLPAGQTQLIYWPQRPTGNIQIVSANQQNDQQQNVRAEQMQTNKITQQVNFTHNNTSQQMGGITQLMNVNQLMVGNQQLGGMTQLMNINQLNNTSLGAGVPQYINVNHSGNMQQATGVTQMFNINQPSTNQQIQLIGINQTASNQVGGGVAQLVNGQQVQVVNVNHVGNSQSTNGISHMVNASQQSPQFIIQRAVINGVVQNVVLRALPSQTQSVPGLLQSAQMISSNSSAVSSQPHSIVQNNSNVFQIQPYSTSSQMSQTTIPSSTLQGAQLQPQAQFTNALPVELNNMKLQQNIQANSSMASGGMSTISGSQTLGFVSGANHTTIAGQSTLMSSRSINAPAQNIPNVSVTNGTPVQGVPMVNVVQGQQTINIMSGGEMRVITLTSDQLKHLLPTSATPTSQVGQLAVQNGAMWTSAQAANNNQQISNSTTVMQTSDGRFILAKNSSSLQPNIVEQHSVTSVVSQGHTSVLMASQPENTIAGLLSHSDHSQSNINNRLLHGPLSDNNLETVLQQSDSEAKSNAFAQILRGLNPNNKALLLKIRTRIRELLNQSQRTPDEEKTVQQLVDAQQKLLQPLMNLLQQQQHNTQPNSLQHHSQNEQLVQLQANQQHSISQQIMPEQTSQQRIHPVNQQADVGLSAAVIVSNNKSVLRPQDHPNTIALAVNKSTPRFAKILPAIAPSSGPSKSGNARLVAPGVPLIAVTPSITVSATATTSPAAVSSASSASQSFPHKLTPQVKEWLQAQLMKLSPDARLELLRKPSMLSARLNQLRQSKTELTDKNKSTNVLVINGSQKDLKIEQGKPPISRPLTKQQLFNHQLSRDQQGALCPDCKQPFRNWPDAIKRLVRYHVFNTAECNPDDVQKVEDKFEEHAKSLLERKDTMMERYRQLLYQESMKSSPLSEVVMLERTFISSEREQLKEDRRLAIYEPDKFVPCPILEKTSIKIEQQSISDGAEDVLHSGNMVKEVGNIRSNSSGSKNFFADDQLYNSAAKRRKTNRDDVICISDSEDVSDIDEKKDASIIDQHVYSCSVTVKSENSEHLHFDRACVDKSELQSNCNNDLTYKSIKSETSFADDIEKYEMYSEEDSNEVTFKLENDDTEQSYDPEHIEYDKKFWFDSNEESENETQNAINSILGLGASDGDFS